MTLPEDNPTRIFRITLSSAIDALLELSKALSPDKESSKLSSNSCLASLKVASVNSPLACFLENFLLDTALIHWLTIAI